MAYIILGKSRSNVNNLISILNSFQVILWYKICCVSNADPSVFIRGKVGYIT